MLNYFEVLGLSVKEIEGQNEATIEKTVGAAHQALYAKTMGPHANKPRPDGRSQKEWRAILNQARDTLKDPQKRREHIAELPETKEAAKKALEKKAAKREASKKAAAAKWAEIKQSTVKPAVEFVLKHAEIISAIGVVTFLFFGPFVLCVGLTAFLYKGPRQQIMIFGASGIILAILGSVLPPLSIPVAGEVLLGNLGGAVVMSSLLGFLFKQSWHHKIMEVTRSAAESWMALTATWRPLFRIGATCWVVALALLVLSLPLSLVFGGGFLLGALGSLLFSVGLVLVVASGLWWLLGRQLDTVECMGCRAKMTRQRFNQSYRHMGGCPACGSDLGAVRVGR